MAWSTIVRRRTSWNPLHSWIALAGPGRRRPCPAITRADRHGTKGLRYPPDPPTVEEIIAVMRAAGEDADGDQAPGVIVVLWRAGLRISEALALAESDLDRVRGAVHVRRGKGGRRREVGMDRWGWEQLDPWLELRARCCRSARCSASCAARPAAGRAQPLGSAASCVSAALTAGVRRRLAPHQLRHAHAVEMSREGVPLLVIQRQLGHADLGITSAYLRGIDNTEIVHAVHERPAPMIPAANGLRVTH